MIVEQQINDAEFIGDIVENKVGIDARNIDFITTLLTSNLYSKPFASFLRETISNAYDSHIEAGTKEPIILLFEEGEDYNSFRISIRDFGTGISPERFEKIYRNIGSSTKRESNDFIGCFGIGRFSCLSCADVAKITSYYNGVKYSYLMYKNNGGINIDKISQENGDFKNGIEVSIDAHPSISELREAIEGLYLFDKLYIENKTQDYRVSNTVKSFNERVVHRGKNYHTIDNYHGSHNYVALGNVLYPLVTHGLDTSGVILNIPIGSVDITPNRESLQYTARTNNVIANKIADIKAEWAKYVSESLKDTNLKTFYEAATSHWVPIGNCSVSKNDINFSAQDILIDGERIPSGYDDFICQIKYANIPRDCIYKVIYSVKASKRYLTFGDILSNTFKTALKIDDVTKATTIDYFRINNGETVVFNSPELTNLADRLCFELKNALYRISNTEIREGIYFTLRHLPIYSLANSNVPQDYIDKVRAEQRDKRQSVQVKSEIVRVFDRWTYKQNNLDTWLEHTIKNTPFIVYAANSKDENELYRHIAGFLQDYHSVTKWKYPAMITVKSSVLPLLKGRKKFVHIVDFLYLRNNFWSKILTADQIYDKYARFTMDSTSVIPIWREYAEKYKTQLRCLHSLRSLPIYDDMKKLYTENNWLNEYDLAYFDMSEEDVDRLNEIKNVLRHQREAALGILFKKFGEDKKLGIGKPSSFIYKYIKQ